MRIDLTDEIVFSFLGPNLCILGNEEDFKKLASTILDLTIPNSNNSIELSKLNFIALEGKRANIVFSSKLGSKVLGKFDQKYETLTFELDPRYWERIFKYFILMTWGKKTYYLNANEDCLI